jgi:hypothetical protein
MLIALNVRGIANNTASSEDFVIFPLRVPGYNTTTKQPVKAIIKREFHVVDRLYANMLISTDVMVPKQCDILLSGQHMAIRTCGVNLPILLRPRPGQSRQLRPVHLKAAVTIPPKSEGFLTVYSLPNSARDFLFERD